MAKGDHKRKARPIGPATVAVGPDSIAVVVPDVLGKNASHVQSKDGGRRISEQTIAYRGSVRAAVSSLHVTAMFERLVVGEEPGPLVRAGAWRLEVVGVWPTQNHDVGFVAPRGDADAAIPQALDALQHAGILDDDARVVEVRAWNLYRKGVRATVMRLVRMSLDLVERDHAVRHLLPLVPQSPEPPAKPKRARKVKPS